MLSSAVHNNCANGHMYMQISADHRPTWRWLIWCHVSKWDSLMQMIQFLILAIHRLRHVASKGLTRCRLVRCFGHEFAFHARCSYPPHSSTVPHVILPETKAAFSRFSIIFALFFEQCLVDTGQLHLHQGLRRVPDGHWIFGLL